MAYKISYKVAVSLLLKIQRSTPAALTVSHLLKASFTALIFFTPLVLFLRYQDTATITFDIS